MDLDWHTAGLDYCLATTRNPADAQGVSLQSHARVGSDRSAAPPIKLFVIPGATGAICHRLRWEPDPLQTRTIQNMCRSRQTNRHSSSSWYISYFQIYTQPAGTTLAFNPPSSLSPPHQVMISNTVLMEVFSQGLCFKISSWMESSRGLDAARCTQMKTNLLTCRPIMRMYFQGAAAVLSIRL